MIGLKYVRLTTGHGGTLTGDLLKIWCWLKGTFQYPALSVQMVIQTVMALRLLSTMTIEDKA